MPPADPDDPPNPPNPPSAADPPNPPNPPSAADPVPSARAPAASAAALFLTLLAVLSLTTRGLTVADAALHLDVAAGIVERGDARLSFDPGSMMISSDKLAGGLFHFDEAGAVRSSLPPGMSLLALPFVAAGSAIARLQGQPALSERLQPIFTPDETRATYRALLRPINRDPRVAAFALIGPIGGALGVAFVWLALLALGATARGRAAAVLALVLSPLGVFAGTCWTQSVTAAALAFGAWRLAERTRRGDERRSSWPLGIALGLACLVRPDHLPLAAPFSLAWLHARRTARPQTGRWGAARDVARDAARDVALDVAGLALPLLGAVALLAAFGLPRDGGGWSASTLLEGAPGVLLSPSSGLLVYAPFAAVAILGARRVPAPLRWLALAPALQVAIYGGWFDWDASLAYGPRFLVPSLPLAAIAFGLAWTRAPRLGSMAIGAGAALALPGCLLAHPRLPDPHRFWHPSFATAWAALLRDRDEAVGAFGVDCAATYAPAFAWVSLASAALALALAAARARGRWAHRRRVTGR